MSGRGEVSSEECGKLASLGACADWRVLFIDPYYAEVVKPDEEAFFDFANSRFTVGWEETYVDAAADGEVAASGSKKG